MQDNQEQSQLILSLQLELMVYLLQASLLLCLLVSIAPSLHFE